MGRSAQCGILGVPHRHTLELGCTWTSRQVLTALENSVSRRTGNTQTAFAPAIWDGRDSWVSFRLKGHNETAGSFPKSVVCHIRRLQHGRLWDILPNTSWDVGVTNSGQNHISHIRKLCRGNLLRKLSPGTHDKSSLWTLVSQRTWSIKQTPTAGREADNEVWSFPLLSSLPGGGRSKGIEGEIREQEGIIHERRDILLSVM